MFLVGWLEQIRVWPVVISWATVNKVYQHTLAFNPSKQERLVELLEQGYTQYIDSLPGSFDGKDVFPLQV